MAESILSRDWAFRAPGRPLLAAIIAGVFVIAILACANNPLIALVAPAGLLLALLVVMRPCFGVYGIVLSTPLESLASIDFQLVKALKLALVGLVTISLMANLWTESKPCHSNARPYSRIFALVLAAACLSTLLSPSPGASFLGLAQVVLVCSYYLTLSHSSLVGRFAPGFLRFIAVLSSLFAAEAVLQSLLGYQGWLGSQEQRLTELGGGMSTLWASVERGSAAFGSSNAAGLFFCAGLLIALIHAVTQPHARARYAFMAAASGLGLMATFSRGALLGLASAGVFVLWLGGHRTLRRSIALVLLALGSLALIIPRADILAILRVDQRGLRAAGSRFEVWTQARAIIKAHPIAGVGFYNYQKEAEEMQWHPGAPVHPHNGLLKALSEEGALGALAYLLYVIAFLRTGHATLRRFASDSSHHWVFLSIACVGAAYFGQELVDAGATFGGSSLAILFVTLLGIQVNLRESLASCQNPSHAAHL